MHVLEAGESIAAVAARHGLSTAELLKLNGLAAGSQPGAGYALLVPDGVDPDGALEVSGMLPLAAAVVRQPGLKLNPPGASRSEPRLKPSKARSRPADKRSTKRKSDRSR